MISNEKLKEIMYFNVANGDEKTKEIHGISETTLKRYKRKFKKLDEKTAVLSDIGNKYDLETLNQISKIGERKESQKQKILLDGDIHDFMFITDTHIGEKHYAPEYMDAVCEEAYKHGIKTMYHAGDVSEGMSNRAGQIYELNRIGYDAQKEYCIQELSKFEGEISLIDGNHDRWFIKSNGAIIVKDICEHNDSWHFIGHDEGDIEINGITIKLFHGEDSSSYAISYRIQKLVESFYGGEKPNVLLAGHVHKHGYFFERNIHCFLGGCLERQTKWMRGKRIAAHTGFWRISLTIGDNEVKQVTSTFYPFYK